MSESDAPSPADLPARRTSTPPPLLFQVDLEPDSAADSTPSQPAAHEVNAAFERALDPGPQVATASSVVEDSPTAVMPIIQAPLVDEPPLADEPPQYQPSVYVPPLYVPPVYVPPVVPEQSAVDTPLPVASAPEPFLLEPPIAYVPPTQGSAVSIAEPEPEPEPIAITPPVAAPHTVVPPSVDTPPTYAPPPAWAPVEAPEPAGSFWDPVPQPLTPPAASTPFVLQPPHVYAPPLAEALPTEPLQLDPPEAYIHPGGPSVDVAGEPELPEEFGGHDHFAPFGQPFALQPDAPVTEPPPLPPQAAMAPPAAVAPEIDPFEAAFLGPTLSPMGEPPEWSPPVPGVPEPTPRHFVGGVNAPGLVSLQKQEAAAAAPAEVDPTETTGLLPPVPGERVGLLAAAPPAEHFFVDHHDPFDLGTWPAVATGNASTRPQLLGIPGPDLFAPVEGTEWWDADEDPESETQASAGRHRGRIRTAEPGRLPKKTRKAPWWELPALIALAILIAVLVKTFVVQPFYIPSASMEKTLHGCTGCSGDRILVNKPIYDFRDPEPGDIVVFNAPPGWNDETGTKPPSNPILRAGRGFLQLIGFVPPDGLVLVKRVIAVGGQTVKGFSSDGKDVVQVSDHGTAGPWKTLVEPFVFIDPGDTDGNANFGPVTVPKGRLWVMGDHRNDSADSRFHCGPNISNPAGTTSACDPVSSTVPIHDVIGKAFVIAWPPSRWRTLGTPGTFAGGLVLPLFFVRRRRRRQRRGRRRA